MQSQSVPTTTASQQMLPEEDPVLALKKRYILHPTAQQVETDLSRLFNYGSLGGQIGTSASTYMLIGDPGSGKTSLLRRFAQTHPMYQEPERDVYPVLFVEVPASRSRGALARAILRALGVQVPHRADVSSLTARAVEHLMKQGVRVLLLDEAQHLVIPEKRQLNYEAADWVKGLANKGVCAIVLAGVPDAWEAYLYNGQLRRRSFGNRRLSTFRLTVPREWRSFCLLLKTFDEVLPFPKPSGLDEELTALRLHRQVSALLGNLSDFLVIATIIGLEKESPCLTTKVLEEAAEQKADLGDMNWINPFTMGEEELRELTMRAEEEQAALAGLIHPTALRRGRRRPTQRDVLG
jgi:hypothetical protein